MATSDSPKRGNGAFVIGCVLGLVFIGGGALVLTLGGGFAAAYLWTGEPAPTGGVLTLHNPGARDVAVTCSGAGKEASATVAPGATETLTLAGVPAECSGKTGDEEVWTWSTDDGTAWSAELPVGTPAEPAPEATADATPPVDPNAPVDPAAPVDPNAPADPNAATAAATPAATSPTATSTPSADAAKPATKPTTSTSSKPKTTSTASTTPASTTPAASSTSSSTTSTASSASSGTPTKVIVSFAKKAKKEKGLSVWLDGKSVGSMPTETSVGLGMHTIAIVGTVHGTSVNKSCTIAASGKDWSWAFDPDAPACP